MKTIVANENQDLNELGQTIKSDKNDQNITRGMQAGWSKTGLLVPLGPLETSIMTS